MTVQEEIGRLVYEAENLSEFVVEACSLLGKGVTRASCEAGLSRNTLSSWVKGHRRPSTHSAWRAALYFGVPEAQILRLAGLHFAGLPLDELEGVTREVRRILESLGEEEVQKWVEYGDLLVLGRQRKMMEESREEWGGEVEGKRD